jgi:putative ABC transport system permease protein
MNWIRQRVARRRGERELADEVRAHLDEQIADHMANGLSRRAATEAAHRAFGSVTLVMDRSRDVWRWRVLDQLWADVRYSLRQFRRTPSFTAAAVLTLAVGIGVNTAVYSVVEAVVLRPLPFADPERLVSVAMNDRRDHEAASLAYHTFFEFRRADVFAQIGSYRDATFTLTGRDTPVQLSGAIVSWNLFDTLGVPPALGRGFVAAEEERSARVVVLGYETWSTLFAADAAIVGKAIPIDGEPHTVVGVAAPGLSFPIGPGPVQVWATLARDASSATVQPITEQRGARLLNTVARLPSGMSLDEARARIDAVAAALARSEPGTNRNYPATHTRPLRETVAGPARAPILVLWGAVTLVLLMACANLSNMLLARSADRTRELGMRMAIGGSRARVLAQLFTEHLVLALIGAVLGVFAAWGTVQALVPIVAGHIPRADEVGVDAVALGFTLSLALVTTILVTIPTALALRRVECTDAVRTGARGLTDSHERLRGALVVAQVSVGLVLLTGATLLGSWLLHLTRRDLGFRPDDLLSFSVRVPRATTEAQVEFTDRLFERLGAMPLVHSVAAGWPLPLAGDEVVIAFDIEGRPTGPSERPRSNMAIVSPGYFRTIGTPVLEGRDFTGDDGPGRPRVIIVNKAFADRFFPGQRAIGRRIASGATSKYESGPEPQFREIVGIVGNARQSAIGRDPEPIYYFPFRQMPWGIPQLLVRTSSPSLTGDIRRLVASLDDGAPVFGVQSLRDLFEAATAAPRFLTSLMSGFAAIGLLLTATGLYGVLSYAVHRRARELGVRIALGANRQSIVGLVLTRALVLIGSGIAIGGLGAFAGDSLLRRLVFVPESAGPALVLVAATVVILLTALAAALLPALRAAAINPNDILRAD